MTERDTRLRIHGNVPTGLIRRAYDEGGDEQALKVGHQVLIDATDEEILSIAYREAYIDGVTPNCRLMREEVP